MKFLVTLILILGFSTSALAQTPPRLSERVKRIAEKIRLNETVMDPADTQALRNLASRMEGILASYEDTQTPQGFICLSNGQSGSFEKFNIYNSLTGTIIGGETSKIQCEQSVQSAKNDLICVSNGQTVSFERFSVFDSLKNRVLGGETSFASCLKTVDRSSLAFVCVSNGQSVSFEKFTVYDRKNNRPLGGETSLDNCLSSLPRL